MIVRPSRMWAALGAAALVLAPAVGAGAQELPGTRAAAVEAPEPATSAVPLDEVDPEGAELPAVVAPVAEDEADGAEDRSAAVLEVAADLAGGEAPAPEAPEAADADPAAGEPTDPAAPDELIVGLTDAVPTAGHDVLVVGATWVPGASEVYVDVRVQDDGTWGPWQPLDLGDAGEGEGDGADRAGSEPYVVTSGDAVQARLTTEDGSVPADARLDVISSDVASNDRSTVLGGGGFGSGVGAAVPAAVETPGTDTPMPRINLRATWGAAAPVGEMSWGRVNGATIHHTAGTNDYTASEVPAILRGIQSFHVSGRGWSDIGYNFLIDRFGGIWEGREGGIYSERRGVHGSAFNSVTTGISVMGNFSETGLTSGITSSLTALVAWKLALHGVSAAGRLTYDGVSYPAIVGHRDVPDAQTACPGTSLYSYLPTLRIAAANRQVFPRQVIDHDLTGDDLPDVLAGANLYEAEFEPLGASTRIGHGWTGVDLITSSPRLTGGAGTDLLARNVLTGRLTRYVGDGRGGFSGQTTWGPGWNAMAAIVTPGDWTGDRIPDLLAVQANTGDLLVYAGDGRGGLGVGRVMGHGWSSIRSVVGVGDMTGDGRPDVVGLTTLGALVLYPSNGSGGFLASRALGAAPDGAVDLAGPGDLTGDGTPDLVVRTGTGSMVTLSGDAAGGVAGSRTWGTGWDDRGALVGAPGWNGDGRAVLITFDADSGLLYSFPTASTLGFDRGTALGLPAGAVVVGDVTGSGAASAVSRDADGFLSLHEVFPDGSVADPVQIGRGWQTIADLAAAGDYDYDGVPDLVAISASGALLVYSFADDGSGTIVDSFQVGQGFGSYDVAGVGGWSRGTSVDLLAIDRRTGQLRWFQGLGRGGLRGGQVIGTGWGALTITALGDVTGSGNNDLLVTSGSGQSWVYRGNGRGGFGPTLATTGLPTGGTLS